MITQMAGSPVKATLAVLELIATSAPELLGFQLETLENSVMRFAVRELATVFEVPLDRVGLTIYRACVDLDRLEKRRAAWRDPRQVLEAPNIPALLQVCAARAARAQGVARRRRLETILRKLERAHDLAKSRAWIEDFIGPPRDRRREGAQGAES